MGKSWWIRFVLHALICTSIFVFGVVLLLKSGDEYWTGCFVMLLGAVLLSMEVRQ